MTPPSARIELTRLGPPIPWLGQLVPVNVDVWRPHGDAPLEPFSLDDVVAAGMIVKWSEHAPPPDERREGDAQFLVQHRTLLVFPESDGKLAVPPVIARWTDPVTKAPVAVISSELHFEAATPQGNAEVPPLVAGTVTLEQEFDRDISKLRVGDGFTRTLTLHATDTDAVVFPELVLADVPGMTAYPAGSRAQSSNERGVFQASLTERVTYVVDRVGPHSMRGLSVRWLEPRSGHYSDAQVTDRTLWAAPNVALGFQCFGTAHGAALATGLGSLITPLLLAYAVVRRLRRGPGLREQAWRQRTRERRAFNALLHAAKAGATLRVLQEIYAWLTVRFPGELDRTLSELKGSTTEARDATADLERRLFRPEKLLSRTPTLVSMLRRARAAMGRAHERAALRGLNSERVDEGESS